MEMTPSSVSLRSTRILQNETHTQTIPIVIQFTISVLRMDSIPYVRLFRISSIFSFKFKSDG